MHCARRACVRACWGNVVLLQVTQSRQAVDVSDAVGLVKQLEQLTNGAVDYEEAIQQRSSGLEQLAAGMEDARAEIDRWADGTLW